MVYKFRVEMTYDKKLNYIRHLNDLDKIWKIKIFNDGEETVRGLQIKLSFVPDFAESWIGHIDEIKAVYVPFWLLNADTEADIDYDATRIHVWEKGDTEYTETEYFDLHRQGSVSFQNVPTDCSRKMDDALMESIEPFHYQDLQPFSPAFLAGYLADRYDVSLEECMRRARVRIKKSVEDSFAKTASAYQTVRARQTSMSMMNTTYSYVLLPVWILNTTWKGQNFIFAMNGQTGKMVGDLPMDKTAFGIYLLSRGVIFSIICMIISFLIF